MLPFKRGSEVWCLLEDARRRKLGHGKGRSTMFSRFNPDEGLCLSHFIYGPEIVSMVGKCATGNGGPEPTHIE